MAKIIRNGRPKNGKPSRPPQIWVKLSTRNRAASKGEKGAEPVKWSR